MSPADVACFCIGAFALGAVVAHRFLPPRIDEQRERMLSDALAKLSAIELEKSMRGGR